MCVCFVYIFIYTHTFVYIYQHLSVFSVQPTISLQFLSSFDMFKYWITHIARQSIYSIDDRTKKLIEWT